MKTIKIIGLLLLTMCMFACQDDEENVNIWDGTYQGTVKVSMDSTLLFQAPMSVEVKQVQGNYYDLAIGGMELPADYVIEKEARLVEVMDAEKTLKGKVEITMVNQKLYLDLQAFQRTKGLYIQMKLPVEQVKLLIEFEEGE